MKLSIVIPVYNEEESLEMLWKAVSDAFTILPAQTEVIFVDDGSKDKSFDLLKRISLSDNRVKTLRFRRNYGQTAAIQAGIDYACGEIIVPMDADLQNDPCDIPKLIAKMEEGYGVVSGWRRNRQDKMVTRRIPSMLANKLISYITGVRLHDYGCTLKAYRSEVLKEVRLYGEMHRFIPAYAAWQGAKITELVVNHNPRRFGQTKYGLWRTFRVVLDLITVKFITKYATRPMHFFGGAGAISLLMGIGAILVAVYFKLTGFAAFVETPLPLLGTFFTIIGVQFILMGLLAEMIMRNYFESSDRTSYSVREIVGTDRGVGSTPKDGLLRDLPASPKSLRDFSREDESGDSVSIEKTIDRTAGAGALKPSVLLLQPLVPRNILWGVFEKGEGFVPPIGLLCIGAYLRERGYRVAIKDTQVERMTEDDLETYLKNNPFDVIGMPTFTNSIVYTYNTARVAKRALPDCKIVFGGVHATAMPELTFNECPELDYIVLGEGEYRFEMLLEFLQGKRESLDSMEGIAYRRDGALVIRPHTSQITDLGALPLPAYDLLDMEKYIPHPTQYKELPNYPIVIQRGCPFQCTFCSAHTIHSRVVRFKPVEKVIEELKLLKEKYGAKGVYFQDSTFLVNKEYIRKLLDRMIEEKLELTWACNTRANTVDLDILKLMKKAGCWMVVYGIESGNQKTLDLMKKGVTVEQNERAVRLTEQAGLIPFCSYILCFPGETYADAMNTVRFAIKLKAPIVLFYLPVPYPATELIEICRKMGGLREDIRWEDYSSVDFSNPVYVNPIIGKENMQKILKYAYRRYYIDPVVILKNIKTIRTWTDIKKYFVAFRAIFGI